MSAPRMTLEQRNPSVDAGRSGRVLRLAAGLIVLAMPLAGCGTGSLWDKFLAKDDTFVEEPADKLYNEGLYLMNQRKDPKAASKKFEEVDRQHPYSDWARKSLLMSAYSYLSRPSDYDELHRFAATRYVTLHPGSSGRRVRAVPRSRASLLRPDPRILSRDQRPHRSGRSPRSTRSCANIPTPEYADHRQEPSSRGARDQLAGKEMADRPLSTWKKRDFTAAINRFKVGGHAIPDHAPRRGGAGAAHRGLPGARHRAGEAQTAAAVLGPQFSRTASGTRTPMVWCGPPAASRPRARSPGSAARSRKWDSLTELRRSVTHSVMAGLVPSHLRTLMMA